MLLYWHWSSTTMSGSFLWTTCFITSRRSADRFCCCRTVLRGRFCGMNFVYRRYRRFSSAGFSDNTSYLSSKKSIVSNSGLYNAEARIILFFADSLTLLTSRALTFRSSIFRQNPCLADLNTSIFLTLWAEATLLCMYYSGDGLFGNTVSGNMGSGGSTVCCSGGHMRDELRFLVLEFFTARAFTWCVATRLFIGDDFFYAEIISVIWRIISMFSMFLRCLLIIWTVSVGQFSLCAL